MPGLVEPSGCGLVDAGLQRDGIREQHEGAAVAVIRPVLGPAVADGPGVAAVGRMAVHVAQVAQAVPGRLQVLLVAEFPEGHGVVEDEPRAAHQMTMTAIVDGAVVAEVLEEAALRIDGARMVEGHRLRDVLAQEVRRSEVGHVAHDRPLPSRRRTWPCVGMAVKAPCRVVARAPQAEAKMTASQTVAESSMNASNPAASIPSLIR